MIPMPNRVLFTAHAALRFPERSEIADGLGLVLDHSLRGHIRRRFDEALRRGITPTLRGVGAQARLTYELPLTGDWLGVRAALVLESDGWVVTTILPKVDVVVVTEERAAIQWPNVEENRRGMEGVE